MTDVTELFDAEYARLVRSLGVAFDPFDAADAVQEAFMQADRGWATVSHYDDPAGWVRRVAVNRLLNGKRNRRRRREILATLRPAETGLHVPLPTVGEPSLASTTFGLLWVVAHDDGTVSVLPATIDTRVDEDTGVDGLAQMVLVADDGRSFAAGGFSWDEWGRAINGGRANDLVGYAGLADSGEVEVFLSDATRVAGTPTSQPGQSADYATATSDTLTALWSEPIDTMTFFTLSSSGPILAWQDPMAGAFTKVVPLGGQSARTDTSTFVAAADFEVVVTDWGDPCASYNAVSISVGSPVGLLVVIEDRDGELGRANVPAAAGQDIEVSYGADERTWIDPIRLSVRYADDPTLIYDEQTFECGGAADNDGVQLDVTDVALSCDAVTGLKFTMRVESTGPASFSFVVVDGEIELTSGGGGMANAGWQGVATAMIGTPGPDALLIVSYDSNDLEIPLGITDVPDCEA